MVSGSSCGIAQDVLSEFLGREIDGSDYEEAGDAREDRSIHHPKPIDSADPAARIEHGPDRCRSAGMMAPGIVAHPLLKLVAVEFAPRHFLGRYRTAVDQGVGKGPGHCNALH